MGMLPRIAPPPMGQRVGAGPFRPAPTRIRPGGGNRGGTVGDNTPPNKNLAVTAEAWDFLRRCSRGGPRSIRWTPWFQVVPRNTNGGGGKKGGEGDLPGPHFGGGNGTGGPPKGPPSGNPHVLSGPGGFGWALEFEFGKFPTKKKKPRKTRKKIPQTSKPRRAVRGLWQAAWAGGSGQGGASWLVLQGQVPIFVVLQANKRGRPGGF